MKRCADKPELLSPAGSEESFAAAVNAGADAVYFGGNLFNARANAKNIPEDKLEKLVLYAHLHGVKTYVTLNTLVYDREIYDYINYARKMYGCGVDAAIVADVGAVSLIHRYLPDFEIHASTQAGAHSTDGADALFDAGASRVVLARELSLGNICRATEMSKAETEVFLHGALCVSHSGQCLFSSIVGGRSGNRGECAQACRLPYNGRYPLSLKDLCLAEHVPELIASGVASLKIEGRMKSPEYVYGVTRIYRRLIDENRAATAEEMQTLRTLFSRGGFTDGYFTGKISKPMTGMRSDDDKRRSASADSADSELHPVPVGIKADFFRGRHAELTVTCGNESATVIGDVPEAAENSPLTESDVTARLAKLGTTLFTLNGGSAEVHCDSEINLSPGKINGMRRDCTEQLARKISGRRDIPDVIRPKLLKTDRGYGSCAESDRPMRTAMFFDSELFLRCDTDGFDAVFVPLMNADLDEKYGKTANGVYLPPVITDTEKENIVNKMKRAAQCGVKYALCGNIAQISLATECGLEPFGDFRLNITNRYSRDFYGGLGVKKMILSPELTLAQIRDIGGIAVVYGRLPLMLTERCFMRENGGCEKCGRVTLTDRRSVKFGIIREYPHRNIILNSVTTYMGDRMSEIAAVGCGEHYIFTTESESEYRQLMCDIKNGTCRRDVRRIGK